MPNEFKKICIIGLGEIGSAILKDITELKKDNQKIIGVDVVEAKVIELNQAGFDCRIEIPSEPQDVYIVAVYNSLDVLDVIAKIKGENNPLVSVESTIAPEHIGIFYRRYKDHFPNLVSFPHRFNPNDDRHRIFNLARVIGGFDSRATEVGMKFYSQFMLRMNLVPSTFQIASIAKVVENAYRYCQIVFAQELSKACITKGVEFEHLRQACNTKWNIDIMEARDGVGGKCLPKDMKYFNDYFSDNMLTKITELLNRDYIRKSS